MTTGKTIALTIQSFVGKVMSLLFNTLSRFVVAFLLRSKHLGSSSFFFFLITDNMVALDCILNDCYKLCVPFYI